MPHIEELVTAPTIGAEESEPCRGAQAHDRIPELDGLRGLAALLVVAYHFVPEEAPGALSVWKWAHFGWVGVDLFFVLSGFLITRILLRSRGTPHYFRNFYARRTLRIFPLYYGVLLVTLVVIPSTVRIAGLDGVRAHQAWLWLYASNFGTIVRGIEWHGFSHFWSLAVEEHFYLVWPALVLWLNPRGLARACVGLVAGAFLTRVLILAFGGGTHACYFLTPCRIDTLATGALLALAVCHREATQAVGRLAPWVAPIALGLIVVMLAVRGDPTYETTPVAAFGFTLLALFWGSVLALALTSRPDAVLPRVFRSGTLCFFGKYSYSLYVFNRLLTAPVGALAPPAVLSAYLGPDLGIVAHLAVGVVLNVAIAVASWHLFEVHFLRLKRYFVPRPARVSGPEKLSGTDNRLSQH